MKIIIRATCKQDVCDALARESSIPVSHEPLDFDATSPGFDRLLEISKTRSRCWFNPWMEFTPAEMAQSRFFQLECRRMAREGPGDYERNVARLRSLPLITAGAGARIRLLDEITLRGARLKPNQVACAGDWMAEFVIARQVGDIFTREQLTGYSLRPVIDPRTKRPYDDLRQLYTDHRMPRALVDDTTPRHPDHEDPADRRQLACLSYDFRSNPPSTDFNRTAEAWSSNDMPVWIVSARVRDCFVRHKLRGWAFRPVLESGTELHAAYTRLWQDVFARIAASHPQHFF